MVRSVTALHWAHPPLERILLLFLPLAGVSLDLRLLRNLCHRCLPVHFLVWLVFLVVQLNLHPVPPEFVQ